MNRSESLNELRESDQWDIVIIGGGASGLGAAVDAAKRGYKTLLLEKNEHQIVYQNLERNHKYVLF